MLDDAERSLVFRPKNGLLDQIVASDLRGMGWSEAEISAFFGYEISPKPEGEALAAT